jgi:O-antigen/teichoic acid export membrane protein
MSGFVGLGLSLRMYQDTARDPSLFPARWSQAFQAFVLSGIALAALFFILARTFFQTMDWHLLLAIALSELTLAPVVALVANAYAAHGWMGHAAAAPVQLSCARIGAVLILFAVPRAASINLYGWLHVLATATAAGLIWRACVQRLSIPSNGDRLSWSDIKAGFGFSAVQASGLALTTLDKSFALRWGGDVVAGRYVAAYRFVSVAVLPVDSLMIAVMPQLFRAGVKKDRASIPLLILLVLATGGYGMVMGALVWYGANLVPWLLGSSFVGAQEAVKLLALYVPLYCVRSLGTNVLLCFGWKKWRFLYEVIALTVMLGIAAWRIPATGLSGAVYALLAAEIMLSVLVWSRVLCSLFGRAR